MTSWPDTILNVGDAFITRALVPYGSAHHAVGVVEEAVFDLDAAVEAKGNQKVALVLRTGLRHGFLAAIHARHGGVFEVFEKISQPCRVTGNAVRRKTDEKFTAAGAHAGVDRVPGAIVGGG